MNEDFFAGIGVEDVTLPSGLHLNLPIRYYDEETIWAIFPADAAKVQQLMLPGGLKPVEIAPGVAAFLLYGAEMKSVDCLAPYNSLGITVMAVHETEETPGGQPAYYVHRLPETTPDSVESGGEIWGWPSTIAYISFEDDERVRRCRVRADGKDMLTLEVQKLPTKFEAWDFDVFTVKGDQILWTRLPEQAQRGMSDVRGGATCSLGDHPFAEELRAVGMGLASVMHGYQPQNQAILPRAGARLTLLVKEKAVAR